MTNVENPVLHLGIAEQGKVYQLQGNYKEALRHYRESIKMVQHVQNGEIFFQHYSQCVMEVLELSGSHDELILYCDRFLEFLDNKDPEDEMIKKYKAMILEKQAIQYLYKNELSEAKDLLLQAQALVGRGRHKLTDEMLGWVQRGFTISPKQIQGSQKKNDYFIVRKEQVKPEMAIELPDYINPL